MQKFLTRNNRKQVFWMIDSKCSHKYINAKEVLLHVWNKKPNVNSAYEAYVYCLTVKENRKTYK